MNPDELTSSVANPAYYVDYDDPRWYSPTRRARRCFLSYESAHFFQQYKLLVERKMATICTVTYV